MVEKDSREEEQCWHVQTVNGENSSVITNSLAAAVVTQRGRFPNAPMK